MESTTGIITPAIIGSLNVLEEQAPRAVLLVGEKGSGKRTFIEDVVRRRSSEQNRAMSESWIVIEPGEKDRSLGIDVVKDLQHRVSIEAPQHNWRYVYIDRAELLTTQAQNALLKTLEELPRRTHIILAASNRGALLPTILSRCALVMIAPHRETNFIQVLQEKTNIDKTEAQRLYRLSAGKLGLAMSLAEGDEALTSYKTAQNLAERFVTQDSTYSGLLIAQEIANLDPEARLEALTDISRLLREKLQSGDTSIILANLQATHNTYEALRSNGNAKLQLDALVVQWSQL